jgi:hypothetical protein
VETSTGAGEASDPQKATRNDPAEKGLNVVGIVLAAVGGGIGVLGFVAFFGAAILWIRLDAAGLPANEAVAVIPKSVLLTTGAGFLVPALLVALGFTALLYLSEAGRQSWATRRLASAKELERGRELDTMKRAAARRAAEKVEEELARARSLGEIAGAAAAAEEVDESVAERFREGSIEAYENVGRLSEAAVPRTSEGDTGEGGNGEPPAAGGAAAGPPAAGAPEPPSAEPEQGRPAEADLPAREQRILQERADAESRAERFQDWIRIGSVIALFAAGAVFAFAEYSIHLRFGRSMVLGLLALGLTAVCVSVLSRFNFAWFALAAFVSVGVFIGFLTYYKTVDDPRVEPAAVLRADGAPEFGVFVAQTSDRVYIGTTQPRGEWRMEAIVREEVTDMTVGPLKPKDEANEYGRRLALEACELARQRRPGERVLAQASGEAGTSGGESCTERDLVRLRREIQADEDTVS